MEAVGGNRYTLEYAPATKKKLLQRIVAWHREQLSAHPTAQKISDCLIHGIITFASLGLLIPLVCKIKDLSYRADQERAAVKFYAEIGEKIRRGEQEIPLPHPIEMKSETQTFNHVQEFTIKDDVLWQREKGKEWKPFFFDGYLSGRVPKRLSADGANLIVIDEKGDVHYRKVLIEGRGFEQLNDKRFTRHLSKRPEIQIDQGDQVTYVAVSKVEKLNWKPAWYNFPVVNRIINLIAGNRLSSSGIISHRGRFTYGYEDAIGRFHKSDIGVTTLYELSKDGRSIRKHDPWAPKWTNVQIFYPETDNSAFIAEAVDASASTILAVGYDVDMTKKKAILKILTNFCDIDTMGNNPLLRYSYDPHEKKARILPEVVTNEGWQEISLPEGAKELFSQITITQTGVGSEARELRIAATNSEGIKGYYKKNFSRGSRWVFVPSTHIDDSRPLKLSKPYEEKIEQKVHSYSGFSSDKKQMVSEASLEHFGEHAYHSTLQLVFHGKRHELQVHKRYGWKTFLGRKHIFYDLVIPRNIKDPELLRAFDGRRCIRANINVTRQFISVTMGGKHPKIPRLSIKK